LATIHELEEQMPSSYFPVQDSRQVSLAAEEFQDLVKSSDDTPYQQAPEPKKLQKPRSSQPQIPQLRAILVRPSLLMPLLPLSMPRLSQLLPARPVISAIQQIISARPELRSLSCLSESTHSSRYNSPSSISSTSSTSRASYQWPRNPLRRIPCGEATMDIHIQNLHRSFENMIVASVS
jgi:hypothetical protein